MNKITACMIVKDEEKRIETCLGSIKDMVDEIVIVDTGSTDKTKELCLKYTDKVYDSKLEKFNFADARIESISYASSDWVLIIDADEYIDGAKGDFFRQFTDMDYDAFCFYIRDVREGNFITEILSNYRLFKKDKVTVHDRVHNQFHLADGCKYAVADDKDRHVSIWVHTGYTQDYKRIERDIQSLNLLHEQLADTSLSPAKIAFTNSKLI